MHITQNPTNIMTNISFGVGILISTCISICGLREYRIEVEDRAFKPAILVVEEGDRVWWQWKKDKVGRATGDWGQDVHACTLIVTLRN